MAIVKNYNERSEWRYYKIKPGLPIQLTYGQLIRGF